MALTRPEVVTTDRFLVAFSLQTSLQSLLKTQDNMLKLWALCSLTQNFNIAYKL